MAIRVGIAGTGAVADACGKIYSTMKEVKLIGFFSENAKRVVDIANKYQTKPYTSLEKFLNDIEVIHIVNKNNHHAELGIKAIKFCKHIIIDKPLDISLEKANVLVDLTKANNVGLHVISNYRFNPFFIQIKTIINDKNKFGNVLNINISLNSFRGFDYYSKSSGWLNRPEIAGGGVLLQQSIHLIDYVRWLVGPISSVYGRTLKTRNELKVEDLCIANLKSESNIEITCRFTNASEISKPEEIEIIGTKGYIKTSTNELITMKLNEPLKFYPFLCRVKKIAKRFQYVVNTLLLRYLRYRMSIKIIKSINNFGYKGQIKTILASIKENKVENYGHEAIETLEIINAIYKSAELNQEIKLPRK